MHFAEEGSPRDCSWKEHSSAEHLEKLSTTVSRGKHFFGPHDRRPPIVELFLRGTSCLQPSVETTCERHGRRASGGMASDKPFPKISCSNFCFGTLATVAEETSPDGTSSVSSLKSSLGPPFEECLLEEPCFGDTGDERDFCSLFAALSAFLCLQFLLLFLFAPTSMSSLKTMGKG